MTRAINITTKKTKNIVFLEPVEQLTHAFSPNLEKLERHELHKGP